MATSTWTSTNPSLGPLTTTFTAPPTCDTTAVYLVFYGGAGYLYQSYSQGPIDTANCYPPNYPTYLNNITEYYYSPGLCPYEYTVGCQQVGFSVTGTSTISETTQICCPAAAGRRYTCQMGNAWCSSSWATPTAGSTSTAVFSDVTTISPIITGNLYTWNLSSSIIADGIEIRFQSTDFTSTTSSAGSSSTRVVGGEGAGGVSSGAVAGIGIGGAVGGFLLAGVIFLLFKAWRRRRWGGQGRKNYTTYQDSQYHPGVQEPPQLASGPGYNESYDHNALSQSAMQETPGTVRHQAIQDTERNPGTGSWPVEMYDQPPELSAP